MREDPFVILGVERGATQNEIYDAYKILRNRYAEERFMEGEAGADAAMMLQKLDLAYAEALEYNHQNASVSGNVYEEIKKAITAKNLDKSQSLLDSISRRDAEWHYYQSIVFYERSWFAECKKQLEIALELEPNNEKYSKSLENLKAKLDRQNEQTTQQRQYEQSSQSYGAGAGGGQHRSYSQGAAGSTTDGCCTACQALICADCCCECMGGDLIRCC